MIASIKQHVPLWLALILIAAIPTLAFAQAATHIVKEGESLIHISQRYDVCVEAIVDVNPQFIGELYDIFDLVTGEEIVIPTDAPPCYTDSSDTFEYIVEDGDTMFGISVFYRVPIRTLMEITGITNPNIIEVGQVIEVPVNTDERTIDRPTPENTATFSYTDPSTYFSDWYTIEYVAGICNMTVEQAMRSSGLAVGDIIRPQMTFAVNCNRSVTVYRDEIPWYGEVDADIVVAKRNDTVLSIALEHDVHPEVLASFNKIDRPYYSIIYGDAIFVPTEPIEPEPHEPSGNVYTLRWGDTLTDVARDYKTHYMAISLVNQLPDPNQLDAGQTLDIPPYIQGANLLFIGMSISLVPFSIVGGLVALLKRRTRAKSKRKRKRSPLE